MNPTSITEELAARVRELLEQPSEASQSLKELRSRLDVLAPQIGRKAASTALRALEKSDAQIKRVRQREMADAIARALKPLGVILTPGEPPKRASRRAKPAAPQKAEQASAVTPEAPSWRAAQ